MYNPNRRDPRVINRIRTAMGFAKAVLSTREPKAWSTRLIDKHFGQHQHELSKYLRDVLLITTEDHWDKDKGICKQYILNRKGYYYLYLCLTDQCNILWDNFKLEYELSITDEVISEMKDDDIKIKKKDNALSIPYCITSFGINVFDKQVVNEFVKREFGKELEKLEFTYKDQSNRLWHRLQNVKREYKKSIMAEYGLKYHYDVEACAPTLLHQYAINNCLMDEYLFGLQTYLKDKTAFRKELADGSETDPKTIKVLINALFSGAKLGNNKEFQLSKLLNHDQARIEYLKQNPKLSQLREDIKTMWTYIEETHGKRFTFDKNNKPRKVPMNAKRKWAIYFELERRVLNSVRKYLTENNIKHFLEHDGWSTNQPINIQSLIEYIELHTSFVVNIDVEVFDSNV